MRKLIASLLSGVFLMFAAGGLSTHGGAVGGGERTGRLRSGVGRQGGFAQGLDQDRYCFFDTIEN